MQHNLERAMRINRERDQRYNTARKVIKGIRLMFYEYQDAGPAKVAQSERIMKKMNKRLKPLHDALQKNRKRMLLKKAK